MTTCTECNGEGIIVLENSFGVTEKKCPTCHGTGVVEK